MEKLKVANKCTSCIRTCKIQIINGDVQYCPDYININSKKGLFIPKKRERFIIKQELVEA